jgi:hypothetical protein
MTELDRWRRNMRDNSTTDPDEIRAAMQRNIDPDAPLYRLELLYDESTKTIILQGNKFGLETLLEAMIRLMRGEPDLSHLHFDRASGFSKNALDLIIQFVNDQGNGPHYSEDPRDPE